MRDLTKIKAILFDFDDTLGNREEYAYATYYGLLRACLNIQDEIEFEAIMQDIMIWDEQGNIHKNHVVDMLKTKYQITLPVKDFTSWWNDEQWKNSVSFMDTKKTLELLKEKYELGIITNGDSNGQRNKIKQAGLMEYFDTSHVIVSGDYGYNKPDIRIFQKAADSFHLTPDECCFVGDIFANDVLGSYRAGMIPIWLWSHGYRKCTADVIRIEKISDLLELL